jgi:ubiquinone/menaquinone biosynthesis C-methylase UbiE
MGASLTCEKFKEYEKVRLLFKKHGYDMDETRCLVLKRALPIKEEILDVGTGPGRMAYILAQAGYNVTTIDVSKEVLEVARVYASRYKVLDKISFLTMDAECLEFEDNMFNTVVSVNLLHEVNNPEKVIREILRVCSKEGKLVIADLVRVGQRVARLSRRLLGSEF